MNTEQSNCSQHKKEVAGISDMHELAEIIGNLHYESLTVFMKSLSNKFYEDGLQDWRGKRKKLGEQLYHASTNLKNASQNIESAWQISKPFMENKNNPT